MDTPTPETVKAASDHAPAPSPAKRLGHAVGAVFGGIAHVAEEFKEGMQELLAKNSKAVKAVEAEVVAVVDKGIEAAEPIAAQALATAVQGAEVAGAAVLAAEVPALAPEIAAGATALEAATAPAASEVVQLGAKVVEGSL